MGQGEGQGHGSGCSGYSCVKYMFFIFNIIFWLLGCAMLGVGIWLHVSQDDYTAVTPSENYFSVTAVAITAGCVMILVSFFGCCGAVMENKCMLMVYFLLVIVIFILEISCGIIAFVYRDDISNELRNELNKGLNEQYGKDKALTDAWDNIQSELECCGVHNYTDWYGISLWPEDEPEQTPESCCEFPVDNCGRSPSSAKYSKGCYKEVKRVAGNYLYVLGIVALTIGILQILGLLASMALFCFLRGDKYDDYYES